MRDQLMVDDDRDDAVLGEEPTDIRVYFFRPQFIAGEESSSVDIHQYRSVSFVTMRDKDV